MYDKTFMWLIKEVIEWKKMVQEARVACRMIINGSQ